MTKSPDIRSLILEYEKMYVTEWLRPRGMEIVYNLRTGGCKTVTDRLRLIDAMEELERAAAAIV